MAFLDSLSSIFLGGSFSGAGSPALAANDMWGGGSLRQQQTAEEQMRWQSQENQIDRDWQKNLWDYQFGRQSSEWDRQQEAAFNYWRKQFDLTNAYNSPAAQVERLRAAGINPSVLFAGGSGTTPAQMGSINSPSVPSPGQPGSHSVSPPGLPSASPVNIAQALNAMSTLIGNIADAKKKGAETRQIEKTTDKIVKKLDAEIAGLGFENEYRQMRNAIQDANITEAKKEQFYKNLQSISESYRNFLDGDLKSAQAALAGAQKLESEARKYGISVENNYLSSKLESEIAKNRSEAAESSAAAQEHKASAGLKSEQAQAERYRNEIQAVVNDVAFGRSVDPNTNKLTEQCIRQIDAVISRAVADRQLSKADGEKAIRDLRRMQFTNKNVSVADAVLNSLANYLPFIATAHE